MPSLSLKSCGNGMSNRQAVGVIGFLVLWVTLAVFLAGCTVVRIVPHGLPIPEAPELTFTSTSDQICLSPGDANHLHKYFLKLEAFREAWDRLSVVK